jgi:hypothetical protein
MLNNSSGKIETSYQRKFSKKGIIGEIVHQIRIDTPDSNSSKTLIRTFESITSKNEMRQHPRYDTAATYGISNL